LSSGIIEPRVLKGFRDLLPNAAISKTKMLETIKIVFDSFGYPPIETPALEYAEILLGKGSEESDKQLFRFQDQGGRDVALRFDLTVPLARFAATHAHDLGLPFRRYHIAPVWRAEKPQRGRFREFTQCDFDIIGTSSILADAEIVSIIDTVFNRLKINHKIRINHRAILNGFIKELCTSDPNKTKQTTILRAIDKLDKLGKDVVSTELMEEADLSAMQIERVFEFLALSPSNLSKTQIENKSCEQILNDALALLKGNQLAELGIEQLKYLLDATLQGAVNPENITIDLTIARGLDYYTGAVFETLATDLPDIGSICSGGRYDNLAGLYTKRQLPGVGASVGLDRTLAALEELGRIDNKASTAQVLFCILDSGTEGRIFALAQQLRTNGIATEVFPEINKLGNQLKYADKKEIGYAIIAGSDELSRNCCSIKNLRTKTQEDGISLENLSSILKNNLAKTVS
jgi:histidyl-tRNA synthetase